MIRRHIYLICVECVHFKRRFSVLTRYYLLHHWRVGVKSTRQCVHHPRSRPRSQIASINCKVCDHARCCKIMSYFFRTISPVSREIHKLVGAPCRMLPSWLSLLRSVTLFVCLPNVHYTEVKYMFVVRRYDWWIAYMSTCDSESTDKIEHLWKVRIPATVFTVITTNWPMPLQRPTRSVNIIFS